MKNMTLEFDLELKDYKINGYCSLRSFAFRLDSIV